MESSGSGAECGERYETQPCESTPCTLWHIGMDHNSVMRMLCKFCANVMLSPDMSSIRGDLVTPFVSAVAPITPDEFTLTH